MSRLQQALLFAVLLAAGSANAQMNFPAYSDSAIRSSAIELDGVLDYQSTSIRRELSQKLIFGGFIDEDMKNRSLDRHKAINRFGLNAGGEIRYINGAGNFGKRDSVAWLVKAGYYAVGNLNYGTDVFGLLFYGNENYLGETAILTNTRVDFTQFQKIGFGILSKKNKSSVTLNLVNVQNHASGFIEKGTVRHNEDASQIDVVMNGNMQSTKGNAFNKGLGLAVDLDYRVRVPWGKSQATFQLALQNIGAAYMYGGMTRYTVDSNYTYSGFELNAFTGGSNPFGDDFSLLDSMGIERKDVKKFILLPGYIQVMKLVDPNSPKKVQSFFGVRLYPTLNTIPSVFAGAHWKVASVFNLSASVAYGGFGTFRAGIYAGLNFPKVSWMIGTDDSIGDVSGAGFGNSYVTKLIWKLQ